MNPFVYSSLYFDTPSQSGRAVDVWIPKEKPLQPFTLFFIHGGGWGSGRRDALHTIMQAFFEKGYVCVSVDYRLGDGVTADMQLSDVREGCAVADAYLREHGVSQPFVLYGSSAGGHLALLAGLAPSGACGDTFSGITPLIAGIIASCAPVTFAPWEEIFPGIWQSMQRAAGASWDKNPEVFQRLSPERYATKNSPALFFLLAECEHMFPNALTRAFVERVQTLGGSAECRLYPHAEHGFFYALTRKNQRLAFEDILTFLSSLKKKA